MRKILVLCIFFVHGAQFLEAAGIHFINQSDNPVEFEFIFTNYVVRKGTLEPQSQVDVDAFFEGIRQVSLKRGNNQWQTIELNIPAGLSGWSTIIINNDGIAINRKIFQIAMLN